MRLTLKPLLFAAALALTGPSAFAQTNPIETVATLQGRPGNPAVTPDGRLIFSQQPLDRHEFAVVEWRDGRLLPFPNEDFARNRLTAVIGVKALPDGTVWMLDMGAEGRGEPKLVVWDTRADRLVREVPIPASARVANSFLQDFAVDWRRGVVTIADMSAGNLAGPTRPAFIILDVASGAARRVLENHPSFQPSPEPTLVEGRPLEARRDTGATEALRFGLNPIAIDPQGEWVYFGTIGGRDVWRIAAASLADRALSEAELGRRIERFGEKSPSDGIVADGQGRLFITDVLNSAIGVTTSAGYRLAVQDRGRLRWPDGVALGPDGSLYVTVNQLHLHPALNRGREEASPPYFIYRIPAAAFAAGGQP